MKISKILSTCFIIQIVTTTSLMAAPTVTLQSGDYQYGSGGEFSAVIGNGGTSGLASGYTFQTFCLERNESLSFNTPYRFEISTAAVDGGIDGGSPDPLGSRTAWLYDEFTKGEDGALSTWYDFDNSAEERAFDAGQLQNALWYLEGEKSFWHLGSEARRYVYLAASQGWSNGDIGDIRVLNLYNVSDGSYAQDVIVKMTPPAVPAPGALLLSALGTVCAGTFRRLRAA